MDTSGRERPSLRSLGLATLFLWASISPSVSWGDLGPWVQFAAPTPARFPSPSRPRRATRLESHGHGPPPGLSSAPAPGRPWKRSLGPHLGVREEAGEAGGRVAGPRPPPARSAAPGCTCPSSSSSSPTGPAPAPTRLRDAAEGGRLCPGSRDPGAGAGEPGRVFHPAEPRPAVGARGPPGKAAAKTRQKFRRVSERNLRFNIRGPGPFQESGGTTAAGAGSVPETSRTER